MLVIARRLPLPFSRELRAACRETFALRDTVWPPALPPPPTSWAATWAAYAGDQDIPWSDLNEAREARAAFWRPLIIRDDEADDAVWDLGTWAWSSAG